MKSLMIKDLEVTKSLSREELVAVRGGSNNIFLVGPTQNVAGGFLFGSPVTQTAPQTVNANETTVNIATVNASLNTALSQLKML
ncbi:MAG: hypothetical protein ACKVQU_27500 [Burkholderiales bacterium]